MSVMWRLFSIYTLYDFIGSFYFFECLHLGSLRGSPLNYVIRTQNWGSLRKELFLLGKSMKNKKTNLRAKNERKWLFLAYFLKKAEFLKILKIQLRTQENSFQKSSKFHTFSVIFNQIG